MYINGSATSARRQLNDPQGKRALHAYAWLRPLLPTLLAIALLGLLALQVHPREIWEEIKGANLWWVPALLAANLASDWCRAFRWRELLAPMQRPATLVLFLAAHIGSAVNFAIPLRAGDAVKIGVVSRRTGIEPAALVGSLVGELLSDLITFSIYVGVALIFVDKASFLWPLGVVAVLVAGGLLVGSLMIERRFQNREPPPERPRARAWLGRQLFSFARGLGFVRDPLQLARVLIAAQGTWAFEALMFYLSGHALGIDLSPAAYLLLVVAANIAGSVPITQAGFGVFELGVVGVMRALGVPAAQAAAYALFVHVLLTTPHVAYGPLAAAYLRLSPAEIRSEARLDASKH